MSRRRRRVTRDKDIKRAPGIRDLGGGVDGVTLWFVDDAGDGDCLHGGASTAVESTARPIVRTADDEVLLQPVTSLSLNESLVFTLDGSAEAAIYPQL